LGWDKTKHEALRIAYRTAGRHTGTEGKGPVQDPAETRAGTAAAGPFHSFSHLQMPQPSTARQNSKILF